MVKKIFFMLSMLVASFGFILSSDIISTQLIYRDLDNMSATMSSYIAKNGGITESIRGYVKKEINADIYCTMENPDVKIGDTYYYAIKKTYTPIILINYANFIQVNRSVVIIEF